MTVDDASPGFPTDLPINGFPPVVELVQYADMGSIWAHNILCLCSERAFRPCGSRKISVDKGRCKMLTSTDIRMPGRGDQAKHDIDESLAAKCPYNPLILPVARLEDGTM